MTTLQDVREYNAYHLAASDRAGCGEPDGLDTPGAVFLLNVRDSFVEAIESGQLTAGQDDSDGVIHEIADGAVPVYTHKKWQTFVDLAAFQEDPSELGADGSDMDKAADVCLYIIAERLCHALMTELADSEEEDDDNDN